MAASGGEALLPLPADGAPMEAPPGANMRLAVWLFLSRSGWHHTNTIIMYGGHLGGSTPYNCPETNGCIPTVNI